MEYKTFEFAERNGDAVIIFSEQDEEQAIKRLKQIVESPFNWRLANIIEE